MRSPVSTARSHLPSRTAATSSQPTQLLPPPSISLLHLKACHKPPPRQRLPPSTPTSLNIASLQVNATATRSRNKAVVTVVGGGVGCIVLARWPLVLISYCY
ncbi:hypothetical protein M8C21_007165 [Ambrosia artemisiifolia]|uniref:Uncharacterized protein n=1 Tax=Ambrosia artemisiifolia TaxID=4212 RepID=A0AAD5D9W7_AMBAR|nr:hypothetical protein M8C21_007165 [Ambrosia artemisiifolia]